MKSESILQNIPAFCFLWILGIGAQNASAELCGVIEFLESKSTAISITQNSCSDNANLSMGSEIEMLPGSRLWLKSNTQSDSAFQLICQNSSTKSVEFKVAGLLPPGLQVQQSDSCSAWVDNKMSCEDPLSKENNVFCAVAYEKNADQQSLAETSNSLSVKIRSLEPRPEFDRKQVLNKIKQEIRLCKIVNQIDQEYEFSWQVNPTGSKNRVNIRFPITKNSNFLNCVQAVLEYFPYSPHFEPVTFNSWF